MNRRIPALAASLLLASSAAAQVPQTWNAAQVEELIPPVGLSTGDEYGRFVAVSGEWTVVGSFRDTWSGTNSGSAYVFRRTATGWHFQELILPTAGVSGNTHEAGDLFGHSVAIDGTTMVIGEHGDNQGGADSGAAFVFTWNGTNWVQEAVLKASNAAASDFFGVYVAIEGDVIVCGASGKDWPGAPDAGSAYVFVRTAPGVWCEQAELSSPLLVSNDQFGIGVSVNDEAGTSEDRIAIGAPKKLHSGVRTGAVFVYGREDAGTGNPCNDTWVQEGAYLLNPGTLAADSFGFDVALESDTLIVGAPDDDDAFVDMGSATFFTRQVAAGLATWVLDVQLFPSQANTSARMGFDVFLKGDRAIAGMYGWNTPLASAGGGAVVFSRTSSTWAERRTFHPADNRGSDRAGIGVALDGSTVILGADLSEQGGSNSGTAYAFEIARDRFRSFCEASTGCPCSNDSPANAVQGCHNSLSLGAILRPSGSTSVVADDLRLYAANIPPSVSCILFGSLTSTSTPFFAGLRCVNVPTVRFGLTTSSNTTHVAWDPAASAFTGGAGNVWYLQAWYRDPTFNCTGSPFATTNLTSGVEVELTP